MAGKVEGRLKDAGIVLPTPPAPAGNYVPVVVTGRLAVVSGQIASKDGKVAIKGKLGADVSVEQGVEAAKLCAINILTQLKAAIGDLDRVTRCVRLAGFVNCTPDFTDQPKVMNGASDVMALAFGEAGKHARAAVGAPSLPLGTAVEVEAMFEIA